MDHREVDDGSRDSRGWGEQHDWVTLLDSMVEGSEWKPIMLVLHDDYCESDVHCREFRREFVENEEIDNLSPYFHMVNLKNSEEHQVRVLNQKLVKFEKLFLIRKRRILIHLLPTRGTCREYFSWKIM